MTVKEGMQVRSKDGSFSGEAGRTDISRPGDGRACVEVWLGPIGPSGNRSEPTRIVTLESVEPVVTRVEHVQAQDVEQGDLIQMGVGVWQHGAFFREVLRVEVNEYQTTGRRVLMTLASTSKGGEQTMTDLLPFLTLTRVAVAEGPNAAPVDEGGTPPPEQS